MENPTPLGRGTENQLFQLGIEMVENLMPLGRGTENQLFQLGIEMMENLMPLGRGTENQLLHLGIEVVENLLMPLGREGQKISCSTWELKGRTIVCPWGEG